MDFDIKNILTKAPKDDNDRMRALENNNFSKLEDNALIPYSDYYIKRVI